MSAAQVRALNQDLLRNFVVRDGVEIGERLSQLRRELAAADDLAAALEEKRAVFEVREYLGTQADVLPHKSRETMALQLAGATELAAKLRRIIRVIERMAGEAEITFSTGGE